PRCTTVGTPSSSSSARSAPASNVRTAAFKKRGFRGTCAKNSSKSATLVTLQRPLPVIYSFFPSFSLRSSSTTRAPSRAAKSAAIMPAGPPPTTATSFSVLAEVDLIFIPNSFHQPEMFRQVFPPAQAHRHHQRVDQRQRRGERVDERGHIRARGQAERRLREQRRHGAVGDGH